jgi:4-hydroxybutyryl-CoA dehydratase/vinylacetyl-CoA-Delta-isomerase
MQEEDWTVDGAMTDVKGDRGLNHSKQADPDLFCRIVERRKDGIVVRGCKAHQTGTLNSHWILVMPTLTMSKEDADFALSFVAPADAEGIFYVYGRQSCDTRKLGGGQFDMGNKEFGGHEAMMIFDDLFVPWGNVFMCGEYEFRGTLVERFAGYHRQSYVGCMSGCAFKYNPKDTPDVTVDDKEISEALIIPEVLRRVKQYYERMETDALRQVKDSYCIG